MTNPLAIAIVPGEEELGEQRRCSACKDWWPQDPEFWAPATYRSPSLCYACFRERRSVLARAREGRKTLEQITAYNAGRRAARALWTPERRAVDIERKRAARRRAGIPERSGKRCA